jgi:ribonuclease MRP protein subunit RMP1
MACTARTCRITGITALYEEIGSEDMREALKMIDEGVSEHELNAMLGGGDLAMGEEEEDIGEVVERR